MHLWVCVWVCVCSTMSFYSRFIFMSPLDHSGTELVHLHKHNHHAEWTFIIINSPLCLTIPNCWKPPICSSFLEFRYFKTVIYRDLYSMWPVWVGIFPQCPYLSCECVNSFFSLSEEYPMVWVCHSLFTIHLLKDIWVAYSFWLLHSKLLWIITQVFVWT